MWSGGPVTRELVFLAFLFALVPGITMAEARSQTRANVLEPLRTTKPAASGAVSPVNVAAASSTTPVHLEPTSPTASTSSRNPALTASAASSATSASLLSVAAPVEAVAQNTAAAEAALSKIQVAYHGLANRDFSEMYGADFDEKMQKEVNEERKEKRAEEEKQEQDRASFGEYPPDNYHWSTTKDTGFGRTGYHDYYSSRGTTVKHGETIEMEENSLLPYFQKLEQERPDNIVWAMNKHTGLGRTGFHDYEGQGGGFGVNRDKLRTTSQGIPIDTIAIKPPVGISGHKNFFQFDAKKNPILKLVKGVPMASLTTWNIIHGLSPFIFSIVEPGTLGDDSPCGDNMDILPWGLQMNPRTGEISGTPLAATESCVVLQLEEKRKFAGHDRTATQLLIFHVAEPLTPHVNQKTGGFEFTEGAKGDDQQISLGVELSGGQPPLWFSTHSRLPPGLKLDPLYGNLVGTPLVPWNSELLITVTDSVGSKIQVPIKLVVHASCYMNLEHKLLLANVEPLDINHCNHANDPACHPKCLPGYENAKPWKCQADGTWDAPNCTPIPCPGSVPFDDLHVHRRDTSQCDTAPDQACELEALPGYHSPSDLKCQNDGTWSYHPALPVECTAPVPWAATNIQPTDVKACDTAPAGVCSVWPEPGYYGGGPLDCDNDGKWILPPAIPIPCPSDPKIAEHFMQEADHRPCATAPEPACPMTPLLGYKDGSDLKCTSSGDWNFTAAVPIPCENVENIPWEHNHVEQLGIFVIRDCDLVPKPNCPVVCKPGYEFTDGQAELKCEMGDTVDTGRFILAECTPIKADGPPDWEGYNIVEIDYSSCDEAPEPLCKTTCVTGFERPPELGPPTIEVMNNGKWSVAGCVETKCPEVAPTIANTDAYDNTKCNTANLPACKVKCSLNWTPLDDAPYVDCDMAGNWNTYGECKPVPCPGTPKWDPNKITPFDTSACDDATEAPCSASCMPGYEPITGTTNPTLTCITIPEVTTGAFNFSTGCKPIVCPAEPPGGWKAFFAAAFVDVVFPQYIETCKTAPGPSCETHPIIGYQNSYLLDCDDTGNWVLPPSDPVKCLGDPGFEAKNIQPLADVSACDTAPKGHCSVTPATGYRNGGPLNCNNAGNWELPAATPIPCDGEPDWAGAHIIAMGTSSCNTAVSSPCTTTPAEGYYDGGPLKCQNDGTWQLPAATPIKCANVVRWSEHKVQPLSDVSACDEAPEEPCDVQPVEGYTFEGEGVLNCNSAGMWELSKAVPIVCRGPIPWSDAHVQPVEDLRPCDTVPEDSCNTSPEPGYKGGGPLACLLDGGDGVWDLPPASAIRCPDNPDATNFHLSLPSSLAACDTVAEPACTVTCETAYEFTDGIPEINCSLSGGEATWEMDVCTPVFCTGTPDFDAHKITPVSLAGCDEGPEAKCESVCMEGYKTANGALPSFDCTPSGTWVANSCVDVQCSGDVHIANTKPFSIEGVCDRSGDSPCKPECVVGAEGNPTVDCQVDGSYSIVGSCKAVICPGIPAFKENKAVLSSVADCNTALKDKCTIDCEPGYAGQLTLQCKPDGTYEFAPVGNGCEEVTCPDGYRVDNHQCVQCLPGQTHPSSSALGPNSQCHRTLCARGTYVKDHSCFPCATGEFAIANYADGPDTVCTELFCQHNQRVANHDCENCPPGTTHAAGSSAKGADTNCSPVQCRSNDYVSGYTCYSCADGYEQLVSPLYANANNGNTPCTAKPACGVNQRVVNYQCASCPAGYYSTGGHMPYQGSTECERFLCETNQAVVNYQCQACPGGYHTDGARHYADVGNAACKKIPVQVCTESCHTWQHSCTIHPLHWYQDCSPGYKTGETESGCPWLQKAYVCRRCENVCHWVY